MGNSIYSLFSGNEDNLSEMMNTEKINRKYACCTRCKRAAAPPKTYLYEFKPMQFQELFIDCIPGEKNDKCSRLPQPEARSGHRVVCDDGNMYSFGGYSVARFTGVWPAHLSHGDHRLFQELWCYNFAEGQWKKLPNGGTVPKELASHSAFLDGNYMMVYGGTGVPFGSCSSNQLNICDLRTLEWKPVETTGSPPTPQYGQATVFDRSNKSYYVIGGTTGYDYYTDIHKLDISTMSWETLSISTGRVELDEPVGRYRHVVAFDGTCIYIIGGGTATLAYDLIYLPAFNIETREWKKILTSPCSNASYPSPRKCQESVQIGDDVFIFGGYDSIDIFMDLWELHLPTMSWKCLTITMPIPLYFHSACLTNAGCMYIFGGVTNIKNNTRTNQIFKIWLKVPNLREMCWEALLHYDRSIKFQPHSVLLDMGIPKEFVTRVHPAPPCGNVPCTSEHWTSDILLS